MKEIVGFESSQLCFNKEEFFKDEFSVDGFVLRYRQQAGLESLRTDLGMYLKVLRSSMIDLINRDYADFVNLSSNLSVRRSFDELLEQTGGRMARLHEVRAQKQYLRLLGSLPGYLDRLQALLASADDPESCDPDGDTLERAASEYNQLTYALGHCGEGAALVGRLRPRVDALAGRLQERLRAALLAGLERRDSERLTHVLRVFATLDQVSVAEALFRDRVVEPYMEEAISPAALRDSPRGLRGLYDNVLRFVSERAGLLVSVTRREHGTHTAPRYDFLVNAVWPCIVEKLEQQLPAIFAPGNPNTLYERYTASMEFVERFERACGTVSSVERLRAHEAYDIFMKKWNLPVYYQIRLQETGGALESALASGAAGPAVWLALQRCWSSGVFLRPLTHRFWQLSLQIVSRYATWLTDRLAAEERQSGEMSLEECVRHLAELAELERRLDSFLEETVLPALPGLPDEAVHSLRASLATGRARLAPLPARLRSLLTERLVAAAAEPMRAVLEIPRLYRRTNRDPPAAASAYVAAMVAPLRQFADTVCAGLDGPVTAGHLTGVATQLCTLYGDKVAQVLTSVQKMEESLRKLKKSRPGAAAAPAGGTDDDKIRRQLALDVAGLGGRLTALGLAADRLAEYRALLALVAAADGSQTDGP
ncbi:Conserved oligomeric Golgi complex subunit 2 [Amphibalanus amphitrite]|uniref:Conserved oligomeric Golgi complex subunit 2 n=1 Tax=Amphibalanus amphitrite TaxID=1232801 RepID=A0A6A4X966_AMPAM|nr:Conserved oligomeric Golgi complex subunit 2 [Amphibalanus amphitrite]